MTFTEYLCKAHNLDYQKEFNNYKEVSEKVDLKGAMISAAFEEFSTTEDEIVGKSRKKEIVMQRQCMMYFLCIKNIYSLKEVGAMFGWRDHSTVIHSKKTVEDYLSYEDPKFMPYYNVIKAAYDNANTY